MFLRSCAVAVAALALTGCASGGYGRTYDAYPQPAYSLYDDYYGGGLGYRFPDFDDRDDDDRYFRPSRDVRCDRARDVCYDRNGLSYLATKRYLGEREANRAYKEYGDRVFLFSPKPGIVCDRRTDDCSRKRWAGRLDGDDDLFRRPGKPPFGDPDRPRPRLNNEKPARCPPKGCPD